MNILKKNDTDLKKKTRAGLENRIEKLERVIARKGIGSQYLARAERIQRNINLALFLGGASIAIGLTAWALYYSNNNDS